MARKMKTSGKLIIGFSVILALSIVLKTTGWWDKVFPDQAVKITEPPKTSEVDSIIMTTGKTLPRTKQLRLAHWTWNSHQAWAYANKGKKTQTDSIFAKNGITMEFHRMEEIPNQISALTAFAKELKKGKTQPTKGVHLFTIMGDAAGWVLNDTNKSLKPLGYTAEIIGFSGFSSGEDKFMGLPAWKENPQSAKGGLVAGVAADGDWNIMIFWCAQNNIPFNPDKRYYDPNALNFVHTDSYLKAAEVYIANKPVELIFKADGFDYQNKPVKKGEKGKVAINGSVTWTPGDKNIADKRGGLVSIASTKEYSNQMPQYIIGVREWNEQNSDLVVKMLASIYQAADKILQADEKLKSGTIKARSQKDARWLAAKYAHEMFGSETVEYWYKYYNVVKVKDSTGLTVEVGGSSVSNLSRNINYFGLNGGTDIGEIVYNRFAKLAMHYYPDFMDSYPKWRTVFNPRYLKTLQSRYSKLSQSSPHTPTFTAKETLEDKEQIGKLTYRIPFRSGQASFTSESHQALKESLDQLVIAANSRVEIHGHTDSQGGEGNNLHLSKRRGQAVYRWLKQKAGTSFPANRVKIIPHGETNLLVQDYSNGRFHPQKMAQNRRVVIKIYTN